MVVALVGDGCWVLVVLVGTGAGAVAGGCWWVLLGTGAGAGAGGCVVGVVGVVSGFSISL
jgi:hypothetical protein